MRPGCSRSRAGRGGCGVPDEVPPSLFPGGRFGGVPGEVPLSLFPGGRFGGVPGEVPLRPFPDRCRYAGVFSRAGPS